MNFLAVILLITSIINVIFQIPNMGFAQQEFNSSGTTESVTSTYDAIIKSILIISQVSILGITFNHVFFQKIIRKKNNHTDDEENEYNKCNNLLLKRFTIILALCCTTIIITSTGLMLIQSYELSQNLSQDLFSSFSILYETSVGQVWAIRIITSLIITALVFSHYMVKKNAIKKKIKVDSAQQHGGNTPNTIATLLSLGIIVVSSINLFSNSMLSHSNSLSPLAVSVDWMHFMSVSIWVGGLFYLSSILLKSVRSSINDSVKSMYDKNDIKNSILNTHLISFLLMCFSFIAITSLCIIGTTGLYLSLIHLQSLNSIFTTLYGQILIIKLILAFTMIFLGRYNQLKIQRYAALTSKDITGNSSHDKDLKVFSSHDKKRHVFFNSVNRSIKAESLIGMSVLITASFLSVTSPPSLETTNPDPSLDNNANLTNNVINADFTVIVMILSVIIIAFGMINFRKNRQQIKDIFPTFAR
jgi:putative copper export protein